MNAKTFYGSLETYARAVDALAREAGMTSNAVMRERLTWEFNEETSRLVRLHCPHVFLNAGMEAYLGTVFEINPAAKDGLRLKLLPRSARYEESAILRWGPNWKQEAPEPCEVFFPFLQDDGYLPSRHPHRHTYEKAS